MTGGEDGVDCDSLDPLLLEQRAPNGGCGSHGLGSGNLFDLVITAVPASASPGSEALLGSTRDGVP
ncbi:hypothetical protein P7K49_011961, partial [Saguinus oedipus]